MEHKKKKRFKTVLPDGSKPSYKDLEQSFLVTYKKLVEADNEVKRLTLENAELRYKRDKDAKEYSKSNQKS